MKDNETPVSRLDKIENTIHWIFSLIFRKTYYAKMPFAILLLILFGITSCQKVERPEKPQDLIGEDKMAAILVDIYLFNAAKSTNRILLQKTGLTTEKLIYEKHGIDSLQFVESNNYYGGNLKKYDAIHQKVKLLIEAEKATFETLVKEETVKDSLQKIPKKEPDSLQKKVLDSLNIEKML